MKRTENVRQLWSALLVVIAVLALSALACGGSQSGEKVATSEPSQPTTAPKVETYQEGDLIQVKDHTVVLNSCEIGSGRLKANFTLENKGAEDLNVSSLASFSAKDSEGVKLEQDIFDCEPGLDGKVVAGDKVKGNICYKDTGKGPYKLYYEASLFGSGAVVWEVGE